MKKIVLLLAISLIVSGCTPPHNASKDEVKIGIHELPAEEKIKPKIEPTPKEVVKTDNTKKVVKVAKFFDFGCGYCRQGAQNMKRLKESYGDKVDIHLMHFLIHPQVTKVHKSSACVGEQGKFDDFFYEYFANQYGKVDDGSLRTIAKSLGTDMGDYDSCMKKPISSVVDAHKNLGTLLGVGGTPFFLVNDSIPLRGAASYEQFTSIIDGLLME